MKKLLLSLAIAIGSVLASNAELKEFSSFNSTTLTDAPVTITVVKGDGGTDPRTDSTYFRLYSKNKLTVTVTDSYVLDNITFGTETSNSTFLANCTATAGTFSATDKKWTADATAPVSTVTIQNSTTATSGHTKINKITVTYSPKAGGKTPVTLTYTPDNSTINLGDAFVAPTFDCSVAEAASFVTYSSDNENLLKPTADGTLSFASGIAGSATITASIPSENETYASNKATYTLTVVDPNAVTYEDKEITAAKFGLATSYNLKSFTSTTSAVTYHAKGMKNSNNIQINSSVTSSGKNSGVVSSANPKNLVIEKIVVTTTEDVSTKMTVSVGNEPGTYTESTTASETAVAAPSDAETLAAKASGFTYTYTPEKAYKYFAITSSGAVYITNFEVYYKPNGAEAPSLKPAGLKFAESEQTAVMGSDYKGQTLVNENDLTVTYTSSTPSVATVDAQGVVTLVAPGSTRISAASKATQEFEAGEAHYVLTVTAKPVLGKITVNGDEVTETVTITEGTPIVFAAENAEMIIVEVVDENNNKVFEACKEEATATWTDAAVGSYTVSVDVAGCDTNATEVFTLNVVEAPESPITGLWKVVKSADALNETTPYLLAGKGDTSWYVFNGNFNQNNLRTCEAELHAEFLAYDSEKGTLTITANGEYFNIFAHETNNLDGKSQLTEGYITCASTDKANQLRLTSEMDKTGASDISLTFDAESGAITAKFKTATTSTSARTNFRFNSTAGDNGLLFNCYSSGQQDIYIYEPTDEPVHPVILNGDAEIPHGETLNLTLGNPVTISMKLAPCHTGYWVYELDPETKQVAAQGARVREYQVFDAAKPIVLEEAGTLHYYAQFGKRTTEERSLTVTGSTTTGISEINADANVTAEVYDMMGRRVAKPAKGGVYIIKEGSKVSKRAF